MIAVLRVTILFCLLVSSCGQALAQTSTEQTVETLLNDAQKLFAEDRPIDARVKLYEALKLAPEDYRPQIQLAQYYLARVGHFSMAYRLAQQAEKLFEKQHGSDRDQTLDPRYWREHAQLLYILSESELNFDRYQESLETLQRFEKNYMDSWFHGTKAWVLLKLKRYDEAIITAQTGLGGIAENGRSYNILGILMSITGQRQNSLDAFAKALEDELSMGSLGQPATPLNNAGEVYREVFRDEFAEAAWLKARSYPDGCDHVLPSLNLATLLIDELRLFAAERTLADFEACFAERSIRTDTEHRSLIALARGRILLRKGDIDGAVEQLTMSLERQQWFGKIGTDLNDLLLAANISLAQALDAKRAKLADTYFESFSQHLVAIAESYWLSARSWWLRRRARQIAVNELEDFEDLLVRHTDAMVEYPTLGNFTRDFSQLSFQTRIAGMMADDNRKPAHSLYQLYLAESSLAYSEPEKALKLLAQAETLLRPFDRLAKAELLRLRLLAKRQLAGWFSSSDEKQEQDVIAEALYELLPSHLRVHNLSLPVSIITTNAASCEEKETQLVKLLTQKRFTQTSDAAKYQLAITGSCDSGQNITAELINTQNKQKLVSVSKVISSQDDLRRLANEMIEKSFQHRIDPAARVLPPLPILPAAHR